MEIFQYILLAAGIIGLVMGYRKNSRNTLLASALVLCFGFGISDFYSGFRDGVKHSSVQKP